MTKSSSGVPRRLFVLCLVLLAASFASAKPEKPQGLVVCVDDPNCPIKGEAASKTYAVEKGHFKEYFEVWKLKGEENKVTFIKTKHGEPMTGTLQVTDYAGTNGNFSLFVVHNVKDYVYVQNENVNKRNLYYDLWTTAQPSNPHLDPPCGKYDKKNVEFQFLYKDWLFINSTHAIELKEIFDKGKESGAEGYVSKEIVKGPQKIQDLIDQKTIKISSKAMELIAKKCFGSGTWCTMDMDDPNGQEIVAEEGEHVVLQDRQNTMIIRWDQEGKPFYLLRYRDVYFYFPTGLETFQKDQAFTDQVVAQNPEFIFPIFSDQEDFYDFRLAVTAYHYSTLEDDDLDQYPGQANISYYEYYEVQEFGAPKELDDSDMAKTETINA